MDLLAGRQKQKSANEYCQWGMRCSMKTFCSPKHYQGVFFHSFCLCPTQLKSIAQINFKLQKAMLAAWANLLKMEGVKVARS